MRGGDGEVEGRDVAFGAAALLGELVFAIFVISLVKLLNPAIPVFALLLCRYVFCLPLLLAYGAFRRGRSVLQINKPAVLVRRTLFGLLGLSSMFLAVSRIDISLVTALAQTTPIFITVLAAPLLGESVGWRRVSAVLVGFAGVLVLVGPVDPGNDLVGIGYGLAFAFFSALMFIYLRKLGTTDEPVSTALWYNMAGVVFAFLLGLADGSTALLLGGGLSAGTWALLVAIGVLASFQQFLMALSHALAPASVLAPVHYASIPLGVMAGVAFFGETITLPFVAGVAVIVLANYYILVRQRVRAKAGEGAAQPLG